MFLGAAHLEGPSNCTGWRCRFVLCTRSTAQWSWVLQSLLLVLQAAWSHIQHAAKHVVGTSVVYMRSPADLGDAVVASAGEVALGAMVVCAAVVIVGACVVVAGGGAAVVGACVVVAGGVAAVVGASMVVAGGAAVVGPCVGVVGGKVVTGATSMIETINSPGLLVAGEVY